MKLFYGSKQNVKPTFCSLLKKLKKTKVVLYNYYATNEPKQKTKTEKKAWFQISTDSPSKSNYKKIMFEFFDKKLQASISTGIQIFCIIYACFRSWKTWYIVQSRTEKKYSYKNQVTRAISNIGLKILLLWRSPARELFFSLSPCPKYLRSIILEVRYWRSLMTTSDPLDFYLIK